MRRVRQGCAGAGFDPVFILNIDILFFMDFCIYFDIFKHCTKISLWMAKFFRTPLNSVPEARTSHLTHHSPDPGWWHLACT